MTLDEQIVFFFAPPLRMQTGGSLSTLHLLRREAQDCLIGNVIEEDLVVAEANKEHHRLFATTMVLMAGIDLLAKFFAGSDRQGKVGERVKAFSKRYVFENLPSADEFAEVLYVGCRNPMLHSFTLHNKEYRITLTTGFTHGVVRRVREQPDLFVISIEGLFLAFVQACRSYEAALRASRDLQAKFTAMFPAYGSIGVQQFVVEPVVRG